MTNKERIYSDTEYLMTLITPPDCDCFYCPMAGLCSKINPKHDITCEEVARAWLDNEEDKQ